MKRCRDCGEVNPLTDFPQVDAMLEAQEDQCPGCGKPDPEHVDHDHVSGEVRGMLCFNCNQALGNVRDDIAVLNGLIDYLADWEQGDQPVIPCQAVRCYGTEFEIAADYPHGATVDLR